MGNQQEYNFLNSLYTSWSLRLCAVPQLSGERGAARGSCAMRRNYTHTIYYCHCCRLIMVQRTCRDAHRRHRHCTSRTGSGLKLDLCWNLKFKHSKLARWDKNKIYSRGTLARYKRCKRIKTILKFYAV